MECALSTTISKSINWSHCKCKSDFIPCSNWNIASWAVSVTEDPSTIQRNIDLFLIIGAIFKSCHRFSTGMRSKVCAGYFNAISNLTLNHSCVYLAEWLGSLSCWKLIVFGLNCPVFCSVHPQLLIFPATWCSHRHASLWGWCSQLCIFPKSNHSY